MEQQNPEEDSIYSWFDYRSRMFDDNPKEVYELIRILLSENLSMLIKNTGIDYDARAMENPQIVPNMT